MPYNRARAATRVAAATTTPNRFAFRFATSVLFTFLDTAVLATYGSTLYHAASGNPLLLLGLGLLTAVLLGSLSRIWLLTLRARIN
jgi:hypothetical protein